MNNERIFWFSSCERICVKTQAILRYFLYFLVNLCGRSSYLPSTLDIAKPAPILAEPSKQPQLHSRLFSCLFSFKPNQAPKLHSRTYPSLSSPTQSTFSTQISILNLHPPNLHIAEHHPLHPKYFPSTKPQTQPIPLHPLHQPSLSPINPSIQNIPTQRLPNHLIYPKHIQNPKSTPPNYSPLNRTSYQSIYSHPNLNPNPNTHPNSY